MNLLDIKTKEIQVKAKPLNYLKLVEGLNRIRMWTTAGEAYMTHWHQNKKRTFRCPGEDCLQCKNSDRAKRKYIVPAIDRIDNQIKVLEFGDQILLALKNFQKDLEPTDSFLNYDLMIVRNKNGSNPLHTISLQQKMTGKKRDREDDALIRDFKADLKDYVRKTEAENESQTKAGKETACYYDPNEDYQ